MSGNERPLVYRWDLDKTYLSTDFDSLRGLWRTAFEPAADKRTLPGAQPLLREISATKPAGIHILSGSPEQMRKVLEEKLRLDGIAWDGFVLKPSLDRLLRGQLRFLRDQVSYKLGALLRSRITASVEAEEVMFGDDAEADAYVYSLYCDLCAGRVTPSELGQILEAARAYEDDADTLVRMAEQLERAEIGRRIFIHLERVQPSTVFDAFGPRVCAFNNYFQPALVLVEEALLSAEAALRVGLTLVVEHSFSPDALAVSFRDLAQRSLISQKSAAAVRRAIELMRPTSAQCEAALSGLEQAMATTALPPQARSAQVVQKIDYLALLPEDRARALRAKHRHKSRRSRLRQG